MTDHIMTRFGPSVSSHLAPEWVRISRYQPSHRSDSKSPRLTGPVIGRWNQFLEKQFPLRSLTNIAPLAAGVKIGKGAGAMQAAPIGLGQVSGMAVAKRVAADQLFMAPFGVRAFLFA